MCRQQLLSAATLPHPVLHFKTQLKCPLFLPEHPISLRNSPLRLTACATRLGRSTCNDSSVVALTIHLYPLATEASIETNIRFQSFLNHKYCFPFFQLLSISVILLFGSRLSINKRNKGSPNKGQNSVLDMVRAYAHGVNASPMVWPLGGQRHLLLLMGGRVPITGCESIT